MAVVLVLSLAAMGSRQAQGQIALSFADVTGGSGKIPAMISVNSELEVSSLNVSIGTSLVSGSGNSQLVIESFDAFAGPDSIWAGLPLLSNATPPGVPGTSVKINNTLAGGGLSTVANGTVLGVVFDATNTQAGDVFQIDLDFAGRSSAALGIQLLSDQLTFSGGTVTILAPSGDFDADGELDVDDIDLLTAAIKEGTSDVRFDVNADGVVNQADREFWVVDLKNTYFGDADLDGVFDTSDFVKVLQAGEYEDDAEGNSTWATGDWSGDCEFDTNDLIVVFQKGGYEAGPRAAVASSVPEPSGLVAVWISTGAATLLLRHQRRASRAFRFERNK